MKSVAAGTRAKVSFIICALLLLLFSFTISHVDCNTITTWAYDLLTSIKTGNVSDYPVYTYETHGMATNYSLCSNTINAIWLAPLYIIDTIFELNLSMLIYDIWYKMLILAVSIISIFLMGKVIKALGYDRQRQTITLYIAATSSVLLIAVLGKGQIDVFDFLFVILAVYLHITDKLPLAFLSIGIGCLFKPFIILLGVPYLFLMIGKCRYKTIINVICLTLPYTLNVVITKIASPKYYTMSELTAVQFAKIYGSTRVEQIFSIKINSILVFCAMALIICFICLCYGIRDKVDNKKLLFYPALLYVSFGLFVDASAIYWYIDVLPLLILMGLEFERIQDFLILNLGINISVAAYFPLAEKGFMPAKNYSVLHNVREYTSPLEALVGQAWVEHGRLITVTTFIVCILLIIALYFIENNRFFNREKSTDKNTSDIAYNKSIKILTISQALPAVLYLGAVYVIC